MTPAQTWQNWITFFLNQNRLQLSELAGDLVCIELILRVAADHNSKRILLKPGARFVKIVTALRNLKSDYPELGQAADVIDQARLVRNAFVHADFPKLVATDGEKNLPHPQLKEGNRVQLMSYFIKNEQMFHDICRDIRELRGRLPNVLEPLIDEPLKFAPPA